MNANETIPADALPISGARMAVSVSNAIEIPTSNWLKKSVPVP